MTSKAHGLLQAYEAAFPHCHSTIRTINTMVFNTWYQVVMSLIATPLVIVMAMRPLF